MFDLRMKRKTNTQAKLCAGRVDNETKETLQVICDREKTTESKVIFVLIQDFIDKYKVDNPSFEVIKRERKAK